MRANIEGLAGFTKRNRRSCEIFYERREKTFLESFHPSSSKRAFIKGELMRYARNSSSFKSFSETRERLRLRGYPFAFLLPLFREIRYSDRKKWLLQKAKNRSQRATVFKTTFNCSHARIRNVINRIMPEIDCTVCYKATVTLANLCK